VARDDDLLRVASDTQPRPRLRPSPAALPDEDERQDLSPWKWLGLPALAAAGLVIAGALGLVLGEGGREYRLAMWLLLGLGLVDGGATLGLAALVARRAEVGFSGFLRVLSNVWVHPPGDWAMFVFGVLGSIPLFAFITRVLIGDSDSAMLVASVEYVWHQDWRFLIHTQQNYLPHVVIGPLLAIGGIPAVKVFTILTLQSLAGVVSLITWKVTRSGVAALSSVAALLSFGGIVERTVALPMYPLMLALGYAGTYLAYRAIVLESRRRTVFAAFAGLCLALSPEAQPVGQIFFLLPALLVVGTGLRRALPGLVRVYASLAVFLLPRAIINLSEGGLSHVLSYRVDFWITKGYLVEIQKEFFRYPVRLSYPDYLLRLVERTTRITGWVGLVVVLLAVLGLLLAPARVRRFGVVAGPYFLAPFLLARGPFFPRYFSPLLVGLALAAGMAIPSLLGGRWRLRKVARGLVAVLCILAIVTLARTLNEVRGRQAEVLKGPYRELAGRITDGKGVIGARSLELLFVDPELRTFGGEFLSEREYVTYLTWPSDKAVIRVLRAHDIGWVLISQRRFEIRYNNVWLVPAYGKQARQPFAVRASPNFCLDSQAGRFRLYKLDCGASEGSGSG
jgi:hypothetical protein